VAGACPRCCRPHGRLDGDETLLLALLVDEGLVDVGDDTTTGDGGLDQGVQLLVTANGELQVAGGDTLHLQILGGVACQLKHLCTPKAVQLQSYVSDQDTCTNSGNWSLIKMQLTSGEVLQDGGGVDGCGGTDTAVGGGAALQQTMDTTHRELEACRHRSWQGDQRVSGGAKSPFERIQRSLDTLITFSMRLRPRQERLTGTSRPRNGLLLVTGSLDADGTLGTLSRKSLCSLARHCELCNLRGTRSGNNDQPSHRGNNNGNVFAAAGRKALEPAEKRLE